MALKLHTLFSFVVSKDALRSGLPVDELLTGTPPNTAKPSRLTHSGSKNKKKEYTFLKYSQVC